MKLCLNFSSNFAVPDDFSFKLQLRDKLATPIPISITVKPFNLAALKVGDFACKMILAPSLW